MNRKLTAISNRVHFVLIAVALSIISSTLSFAQSNSAVLRGQVQSPVSAAIPGAMLQWSAVGINISGTGYSDEQGNFAFELPVLRGSVSVQLSVTANLYLPTQVLVQVTNGQTTNVPIVLNLKPASQLAKVTGSLKDTKTHKPIPGAVISILGAGAVISTRTNGTGHFLFKKVGFNSSLTIHAEALEPPCIATADYPLAVTATPVAVALTAQTLYVDSPHCPNNEGFQHQTQSDGTPPPTSIDDTLQWKQADTVSISTNTSINSWNAGHVNDILRQPPGEGIVVASDEGGVWLVSENPGKSAITPSFNWPAINMTSLAHGPDGSGHAYGGMKNGPASPGMLWETDTSTGFPLLNWLPVNPQPPCANIMKILVIAEVRRVVLACQEGLVWSTIPAFPSVHNTYSWQMAIPNTLSSHAFSGLAKGAGWVFGSQKEGNIIASWWGDGKATHPLYTGVWKNGQLVLTTATVQQPVNPIFGRTSVASCPANPNLLYAVEAQPGSKGMNAVFQSTTAGTSWTLVTLPSTGDLQGDYNNVISVSGDCSIVAVGFNNTYLSYNSGATWSALKDIPGYDNLHADIHALTFDPADPATLFIGSDGGVASASALAPNATPVYESDWSRSILNLQFGPGAASTSFDGLVAGAAQDNGVLYADLPAGPWQHVTGCACDGGQAFFVTPPAFTTTEDLLMEREWGAPNFPLGSVLATSGFVPFAAQKDTPLVPPLNNQSTVNSEIAQPVPAPGGFINAKGEPMIAVNGGDATSNGGGFRLFGLFSMPDGSDLHWELLGEVPAGQSISAVAPTANGSSTFVGTDHGNIYRFDAPYQSTALLTTVNPPQLGASKVTGLTAFFSTVAWATYNISGHGYVLQYNGSSWNQSGANTLPSNMPFNSIAARDLNTIFVSTSTAVYDTRNAGVGWSLANVGLPANLTHSDYLYYLPFTPSGKNGLYLYTWGRSLWVTPVP